MNRLPRLAGLTADAAGWGFFLCTFKEVLAGRGGSEFLVLGLQDATGSAVAKVFSDADRLAREVEPGDFLRVEGRGSVYNGQVQLVLSALRRVNPDQDRPQGFREDECILSAPRPLDEMWAELERRAQAMADPHLRVLVARVLADHEAQIRVWPAARQIHHAYRGGLLEHITKMAEVGDLVSRAYAANQDLVFAGVVLHDIGKLQELAYEGGLADYTRDGNLVGHIGLGLILVREAIALIPGFPDELRGQVEHLVASHHGSREFGSPTEPKTIEAFVLAAIDDLDAKIHQVRRAVSEDGGADEFTAWHKRLGRVLYKG